MKPDYAKQDWLKPIGTSLKEAFAALLWQSLTIASVAIVTVMYVIVATGG